MSSFSSTFRPEFFEYVRGVYAVLIGAYGDNTGAQGVGFVKELNWVR